MPIFAAVDIGANSVRLKIAALEARRLRTLHEDREVTRLGEGVYRTGLLDPDAMALTVRVLERFLKAAQQHGATETRVVSTSPLRDARNAASFIEWVKAATGWTIEVISGLEEGRLIHLGVLAHERPGARRQLLIDLGGGSCELVLARGAEIESVCSLPLGAVRLTRDFLKHDPPRKNESESLREFIGEEIQRVAHDFTQKRIDRVVATSGTPAALIDMWSAEEGAPVAEVPREALSRLYRRLSKMSEAQRRAEKGIGVRRAEIIVAGAAVFYELHQRLGLRGFEYSPCGLRDGLLYEMSTAMAETPGQRKLLQGERERSVERLAEHYQVDERFAGRVRELSLQLFKGLQAAHGLPESWSELLAAAAMLHESGSFINRAGRHRHTYYVLSHSEIFGFTARQRAIVAAIARYVGKSRPSSESRVVRALPEADRPLLTRAVLLLRLARALEQGRRGAVIKVDAKVDAARIMLKAKTRASGAELEMWAVEKEKAWFQEVYGRALLCEARPQKAKKSMAGD